MVSDLSSLRSRLEAKRYELRATIAHLQQPYTSQTSAAGAAEGVQDAGEMAREVEEQAEKQSICTNQRLLLDEIEQALQRLDRGTYGRCSACGQPIPARRLEAIPWAARDVACEARMEHARSEGPRSFSAPAIL